MRYPTPHPDSGTDTATQSDEADTSSNASEDADTYRRDDDGDLWVKLGEADYITLDLIDKGDLHIPVTDVAVEKKTGDLLGIVTEDGQANIDEYAEHMAPDVWQETNTTGDGISVATYKQYPDSEPIVVDETWHTWAELRHRAGSQPSGEAV
jgi:hypothetical protein